jgi:Protein SET DOMAIN GROUP 2 C-terminal
VQGPRPGNFLYKHAGLTKADLSKKYGPWFMWGQLNCWFKQTIYDPTATLSAGRRGTISLPDIESCYLNSKARYNQKVWHGLSENFGLKSGFGCTGQSLEFWDEGRGSVPGTSLGMGIVPSLSHTGRRY